MKVGKEDYILYHQVHSVLTDKDKQVVKDLELPLKKEMD